MRRSRRNLGVPPAPFPAKSPWTSLSFLFPTSELLCSGRRWRGDSTSRTDSGFCADERLQNCFNEASPCFSQLRGSSTATQTHVVGTPRGVLTHLESPAKGLALTACSGDTKRGALWGKNTKTVCSSRKEMFLKGKAMLPAGNKSSSVAGTQGMSQRGFSASRHWTCSCSKGVWLFPCLEQKIPCSSGSSSLWPFPRHFHLLFIPRG